MTHRRTVRPHLELAARRSPELLAALEASWTEAVASGLVVYDPAAADVETVEGLSFRYHFLPRRSTRPGARKSPAPPSEGIRLAHAPCPFDGEEFVSEREAVRLERSGRVYHLVCNRYPVTPFHFLPVRSWKAPPELLPQHFHGPDEIEDLLLILLMAGPPHHVYFNSNRGADNSQSGSSVNHWHGQLFPLPVGPGAGVWDRSARIFRREEGLSIGRIDGWPAQHMLVDAAPGDCTAAAGIIWREAQELHQLNVAYNFEAVILAGGTLRAFLFPRHPGPEVHLEGVGRLDPNFGGWELTGDIVIPTKELLEWVRQHPRQSAELTAQRLRETTRLPVRG